ncbi:casein kinase substrate phosphoprotein PP28-domain-containing protein [Papiliotrema laurentii]|uniref:Casein kinase substrate phosphoprotein PP28-domain-containing protein n=1 Tax=Papiliotrema laurentii TaxID=5418 RepID=A0AAD9L829_PAPLA|nr:casein kinase substrate phosphoprotein PP28-domain-containing protein [Papiliotrema laurentii]
MGRGGGVSSRGRGKFKVSRGGGRHFSRDLDPRDILKGNVRGSDDESEEESEEEESSEDEGPSQPQEQVKLSKEMAAMNLKLGNTEEIEEDPEENMSRAERKALKKAQAEAKAKKNVGKAKKDDSDEESESEDDIQPLKAAEKPKAKFAAQELSRKEREAAEKKAAQEKYARLHAQGKTAEAKSDLARLQEVRRRREQAAAQREAEAAEAAKEAEAKKAARK